MTLLLIAGQRHPSSCTSKTNKKLDRLNDKRRQLANYNKLIDNKNISKLSFKGLYFINM